MSLPIFRFFLASIRERIVLIDSSLALPIKPQVLTTTISPPTLRGSWRVRKPLYANCRIRRLESTRFLLHPSVITSITPFLNFVYLFINKWSETGCKGTKKAAIESPTVGGCHHYIQPPQQPLHTQHSVVRINYRLV